MDIARTQGDIIGLETALKANPALKGDAEALRETKEYKAEMKKYGIGAGIGKGNSGSKGSAMPVATPTKASNDLIYQSNGKHTPGQVGYNRNAGTEPANSIQLFGNSIDSGKKRYALDEQGNVHQFTNTNDGSWHWSGSTGDASVPLRKSDIPNSVKK
ncbi:TPA: hypothetical protein ACGTP8_002657 [Yersinia enterocolitica]|nr:hypothetical protein [Yersinia massiliensis]MDN0128010.1 hypothetical protein [Yersinia massiliensis]